MLAILTIEQSAIKGSSSSPVPVRSSVGMCCCGRLVVVARRASGDQKPGRIVWVDVGEVEVVKGGVNFRGRGGQQMKCGSQFDMKTGHRNVGATWRVLSRKRSGSCALRKKVSVS